MIIPDLMRYLPVLFEGQTDSEQYRSLMQELEQLAERSDSLYTGTGGVREEQFPEYHQCALDLLETLASYILSSEEVYVIASICRRNHNGIRRHGEGRGSCGRAAAGKGQTVRAGPFPELLPLRRIVRRDRDACAFRVVSAPRAVVDSDGMLDHREPL